MAETQGWQRLPRPCTNCAGVGQLWHVCERAWPADGRDMPQITPTPLVCPLCGGSGIRPEPPRS